MAIQAETLEDSFYVHHIEFEGNTTLSRHKLLSELSIRFPFRWMFWAENPLATKEDVDDNLAELKKYYSNNGFFNVKVTYVIEPHRPWWRFYKRDIQDAPPTNYIIYRIQEGKFTQIKSINLEIQTHTDTITSKMLLSKIPLKIDTRFTKDNYLKTKAIILNRVATIGFAQANLTGKVKVDKKLNQADIDLSLDPGKKFKIGPIAISGNNGYVRDEIIFRALEFSEGEIYSIDKINESQRKLYGLDVFKIAHINNGQPDLNANKIPMKINAIPKKRQSVKLGVGYGTEDGFRIKGGWAYRNLFGWGNKFYLSAKHSDVIDSIQKDFVQPYFWDAKNTLKAKLGFEQERLDAYTNQKLFGQLALDRNFMPNWSWTAGIVSEMDYTEQINSLDIDEIDDTNQEKDYFITSVELGINRNTSDNDLNPTKGSVFSFSVERSSLVFGSDISYIKPTLHLKKYIPFLDDFLLAGQIRLRTIKKSGGDGNIPIFKRLYLGGSNSVRGYEYQSVPPLDENLTPSGGLTSFDGSLEIRFPLFYLLSGAAFLDCGTLDKESFRINYNNLLYTFGMGIRYHTNIGPVRVDVGYKLNPPVNEDIGITSNPDDEIGGRFKFHISVGQAF